MQAWRPVGRRRPASPAEEQGALAWWKAMAWGSLFVRFALPTLLLWAWGLALHGGAHPGWWGALALVSIFNAWQAFGLLLGFQRGLKERLYLWPARVAADVAAPGLWALVAGLAWLAAALGPAWSRPLALAVGSVATFLAAAFGAYACVSILMGPRTLRLREQDPGREGDFPPPMGLPGRLRLAHLSDLHLTVADDVNAEYGGLGGNAAYRALLKAHGRRLQRQQAVLLTGDLVDSGRAGEWERFFDPWDRLGLGDRCVFVPGNHEINIIDPGDWSALDPAHVLRAKRLVRTLAALDRLQGQRAWVLGPQGPRRLRQHLADHAALLTGFIEDPGLMGRPAPWLRRLAYLVSGRGLPSSAGLKERLRRLDAVWRASFPQMVELPGTRALAVVVNSNVDAVSLWDNALGQVTPEQLARLQRLAALPRFRGRPRLTLLHHHVALPPLPWGWLRNFKADLMSLLNPRDLVAALPPGRQLILHGHKHLSYFGRLEGRFQVVSAPSSTLRDERAPRRPRGFYTLAVAWGPGEVTLAGKPEFWDYKA